MTRFFTSKRLMVLLASFILLAALVGLTLRERKNPTWPEVVLIDAFGWVQGMIYAPVQHVAGFFEDVQHIKELYEENARLKANLNEYSSMRVQIQELERQNKKLKEDLGLIDRSGELTTVAANVVGRSPSTWNAEITIDVGSKAGIAKDMAVITASKGLVGRVYEVTPNHAKVLLITDKGKMGISARVQNGDDERPAFGIIGGASADVAHSSKPRVEMTGIPLGTKEIKPGQPVVTSGLSDIFPPSLIIGTVISSQEDKLGLTRTAEIEPAANLNNLEFLYVITASKKSR